MFNNLPIELENLIYKFYYSKYIVNLIQLQYLVFDLNLLIKKIS